MRSYVIAGLCPLLVYVSYYLIASYLASRRHARNAARLGCKEPIRRSHRLPLAVDIARRLIKADKEKRIPDLFLNIYEELGRPATWKQYFLGDDSILTVDPKNIQAILATQFNDFSLGEGRRRNFSPLLGNGIFTADGKAW